MYDNTNKFTKKAFLNTLKKNKDNGISLKETIGTCGF